ncbi:hypothetical protein ACFUC1_11475 [Pedococcus sp. NPDC057267]|uniref:hypothetical protein n=1 Tax=Pedococcus sp. NPDC057267 TaxID=3346077 RepID=UPI0036381468
MRWEDLFADLESQWDAEQRRELDAEVADRTRRERATVALAHRLAAAGSAAVSVTVRDGTRVSGQVADVGDGWFLLGEPGRVPCLVPTAAVVSVTGLAARAVEGSPGRRFGLGYALRAVSRDRAVVRLTDFTGSTCTGTIDAVGSDHLGLAEHAPDLPRRPENVTGSRVVPFDAIVLVRPV